MAGVTNLVYRPKKHIEIVAASSNNQIIGRALFCLSGDTIIKTATGDFKLQDLADKQIQVLSSVPDGSVCLSNTCTVKQTALTDEVYELELVDGSHIECTPEHRFQLKDGSYKMAKDLLPDDDIMEISSKTDDYSNCLKEVTDESS